MELEVWGRLEGLFEAAIDKTPEQRRVFLERHCPDAEVRREIDQLFAADGVAGDFLEGSALRDHRVILARSELSAESLENLVGARLGAYRLLEVLGIGGMGAVFRAEQTTPFERQVALKLIRSEIADSRAVDRFEAESQALARMSHPHVAQVYEAGVAEGGRPYLVMELVPGEPLTTYCDRHRCGIESRLELFRAICRGVQHLHQKAVIHRDLKPSNLLVMEEGGRPLPKIIDLGIAQALDQPFRGDGRGLRSPIMGTPAYLSPEALAGSQDLDTRSDIYSLGVVLFELLAGARPAESRRGSRRRSQDREVEAPPGLGARYRSLDSASRAVVAASRGLRPRALGRLLDGDLSAIVAKAMAVEVEERYPSAAELDADLQRFLEHRPVTARDPTLPYRFAKLLRRRALGLAVVAVVVVALAGGMILRTLETRRANREAEATRQMVEYLVDMFRLSDPSEALGELVTAKGLLARGEDMVQRDLSHQPLMRARLQDTIGRAYHHLGVYDRARAVLEEALETRRRLLGPNHLEVAASGSHLAEVLIALGEFDHAEGLARLALSSAERSGAEGDQQVIAALLQLVNVALVKGDTEGSDRLLQRALELCRTSGRAESREHMDALAHLAWLSERRGHSADAEELFRQALALGRRLLPPNHPQIGEHLYNLGVTLLNQLELEEAETVMREALGIRQEALGAEHPGVAECLHSLANLCRIQRRLEEAKTYELRALEIGQKVYAGNHYTVALSNNHLAQIYHLEGDFAMAESLYLRALEIWEATMGPEHDMVASSLSNLGELYLEQGEPERAEPLLQRAVGILEQSLGPEHPYLGHPISALGKVALAKGDSALAERHLGRALAIWDREEGYHHPKIDEIRTLYERLPSVALASGGVSEQ